MDFHECDFTFTWLMHCVVTEARWKVTLLCHKSQYQHESKKLFHHIFWIRVSNEKNWLPNWTLRDRWRLTHLFPSSFSVTTTSRTCQKSSPFTFFPSLVMWPMQIPAISPRCLDVNSKVSVAPLWERRKTEKYVAATGWSSRSMSPNGEIKSCWRVV